MHSLAFLTLSLRVSDCYDQPLQFAVRLRGADFSFYGVVCSAYAHPHVLTAYSKLWYM